jgi:hypothetical protein
VFGKQGEHVIKKSDAGVDFRYTGTINIQAEINLGLRSLADALGSS